MLKDYKNVAMVLEHGDQVEARGRVPIAELLGTRISNSAFHDAQVDTTFVERMLAG